VKSSLCSRTWQDVRLEIPDEKGVWTAFKPFGAFVAFQLRRGAVADGSLRRGHRSAKELGCDFPDWAVLPRQGAKIKHREGAIGR
jgi:hypothetical protein